MTARSAVAGGADFVFMCCYLNAGSEVAIEKRL